ncbi:MAG: hypothetical protein RL404_2021, partial [Pseudomonadota bacterium]
MKTAITHVAHTVMHARRPLAALVLGTMLATSL